MTTKYILAIISINTALSGSYKWVGYFDWSIKLASCHLGGTILMY